MQREHRKAQAIPEVPPLREANRGPSLFREIGSRAWCPLIEVKGVTSGHRRTDAIDQFEPPLQPASLIVNSSGNEAEKVSVKRGARPCRRLHLSSTADTSMRTGPESASLGSLCAVTG